MVVRARYVSMVSPDEVVERGHEGMLRLRFSLSCRVSPRDGAGGVLRRAKPDVSLESRRPVGERTTPSAAAQGVVGKAVDDAPGAAHGRRGRGLRGRGIGFRAGLASASLRDMHACVRPGSQQAAREPWCRRIAFARASRRERVCDTRLWERRGSAPRGPPRFGTVVDHGVVGPGRELNPGAAPMPIP